MQKLSDFQKVMKADIEQRAPWSCEARTWQEEHMPEHLFTAL